MPLTEQTQAMISGSEVLFNGAGKVGFSVPAVIGW
jgi:hypothetical protein